MSRECPTCRSARVADPNRAECWLHPSAERPGQLLGNACGRYFLADGLELVELDEASSRSFAALRAFTTAYRKHFG